MWIKSFSVIIENFEKLQTAKSVIQHFPLTPNSATHRHSPQHLEQEFGHVKIMGMLTEKPYFPWKFKRERN